MAKTAPDVKLINEGLKKLERTAEEERAARQKLLVTFVNADADAKGKFHLGREIVMRYHPDIPDRIHPEFPDARVTRFQKEEPELLTKMHSQLRKMWSWTVALENGWTTIFAPNPEKKVDEKGRKRKSTIALVSNPYKEWVLPEWLKLATRDKYDPLIANAETGQLEFAPGNLPGQLVTAVLENWKDFRVCGNPECLERFFLSKRSDQRYCERGDCTKYAQRLYAREYHRRKKSKEQNQ